MQKLKNLLRVKRKQILDLEQTLEQEQEQEQELDR